MTIRKEWLVDLFEGITFSVVEKVSKAWKTSLTQTEKRNSDRASGFEKCIANSIKQSENEKFGSIQTNWGSHYKWLLQYSVYHVYFYFFILRKRRSGMTVQVIIFIIQIEVPNGIFSQNAMYSDAATEGIL